MGIFDRLSTVIRSNINDLISRSENPEKMLNQLIADMKSQLAKAKQQVAAAIADEKKLFQQVEREKDQAAKWEQRAMMAVRESKDDLAKEALVRQSEHMQNAVALHETWVRHKEQTERLKLSLRELNDKIDEAKRKKSILLARQKSVQAQQQIRSTMSSMSETSALETFDRMEEKIADMERKALASAELSSELEEDDLAQRFKALEYHGSADDQLLALKQKMGLLEAGSPEERKQLGDGGAEDVEDGVLLDDEGEDEGVAEAEHA